MGHACAGGLLIGLAFGLLTRLSLKIMHSKGHKAPEQLALTLAMAYLAFYIANSPCEHLAPRQPRMHGEQGCVDLFFVGQARSAASSPSWRTASTAQPLHAGTCR